MIYNIIQNEFNILIKLQGQQWERACNGIKRSARLGGALSLLVTQPVRNTTDTRSCSAQHQPSPEKHNNTRTDAL